jgi:hypothetical protein
MRINSGGLSIHNLEWVEVASAWVDTYAYGVKLDRDLVIAWEGPRLLCGPDIQ